LNDESEKLPARLPGGCVDLQLMHAVNAFETEMTERPQSSRKPFALPRFTHPMKEDVKKKRFSPPLRKMRVW
jgi:hypothetical protein